MAEELAARPRGRGSEVTMRLWRGDETGGEFAEYLMPAQEGEVVLDVIHRVQASHARTWPAGGTARRENAAPVRRRSTGARP